MQAKRPRWIKTLLIVVLGCATGTTLGYFAVQRVRALQRASSRPAPTAGASAPEVVTMSDERRHRLAEARIRAKFDARGPVPLPPASEQSKAEVARFVAELGPVDDETLLEALERFNEGVRSKQQRLLDAEALRHKCQVFQDKPSLTLTQQVRKKELLEELALKAPELIAEWTSQGVAVRVVDVKKAVRLYNEAADLRSAVSRVTLPLYRERQIRIQTVILEDEMRLQELRRLIEAAKQSPSQGVVEVPR